MLKLTSFPVVIALSIAVPLGVADTAFAAKKHLTYEQAWAQCKKFTDALARDAHSQRYSRGAACMHHHGYRL
jgi:surface antigen